MRCSNRCAPGSSTVTKPFNRAGVSWVTLWWWGMSREKSQPLDTKDGLVPGPLRGNESITVAIHHQIEFFKHYNT
jgi:hypothetical protein